ncbi:MAG: RdgB/HAM1 family non-canonical purine NTP pyrophosphatase [Burkholderiales bacterium]|nr:RdgB/HAM1 family non-canonical purine NTP pyrophosphatase [Burkholderiales bacterium]
MKKIVIASNNPGKVRELAQMLAPLGIEAVPQSTFVVPEAEEPHDTFLENALAKARHAANMTGLPALADDSGLCVPALFGEPGVHSAYYAGREGSREERDARNNAKLIEQLRATPDHRAYYYCVLVLVRTPNDPTPIVADGEWHGEIVAEPRGTHGFGYDPHFLTVFGKTAAEMPPEAKNRVSHRARALGALVAKVGPPADPSPRP